MSQPRFLTSALAGAVSLSLLLSACGRGAQPSPTPAPTQAAVPTAEPTIEPTAEVTSEPTQAPASTQQPVLTQAPAPTPEPTQAPADQPDPSAGSTVDAVWSSISTLELPSLMDMDADVLSALYGLSSDDLAEYVGKLPMMSVHATEFLIAKAQPGKLDTVKAALEQRVEDLKAQWSQYLPEQLELVENAKILTSGDYIMLAITEYADEAVNAFQSCTE